ncbi:MAG TPA: hypothetical protein VHJ99_10240 [Candidatus Dormibacteraeota bacterium]|nr:hypothetical protein [Candidatus Dormibacteraeota bacterium]
MPDLLVIYGAIAGSAGLFSLGWQIATRREDNKTRVSFDVSHHLRTLHPGDPGYDQAREDARRQKKLTSEVPPYLQVAGTVVTVTNHSRHSIHVRGGGIEQPATHGTCAMFEAEVTEVKPRTTFREFWIPDWWSEGEEEISSVPIRCKDSSTWTMARPIARSRHSCFHSQPSGARPACAHGQLTAATTRLRPRAAP